MWYNKPYCYIKACLSTSRIEGASKLGREWAIPVDSERPVDKRITIGEYKNWRKKDEKEVE